jgi:putative ABC transport system permease protein
MFSDIKFSIRSLLRTPGFTAVALATLAIGIGASTAIFSAVNPILFQSLPYPHAEKVMMIREGRGGGSRPVSFGTYYGLAERSRSFEALAVLKPWQPVAIGKEEPERLEAERVSSSYFRALGVRPTYGRDFQPSDDKAGSPDVVILSDGLWRHRFAADTAIIGRQISLEDSGQLSPDGNRYTVVGIMPSTFDNVLAPAAQLWTPLQYDSSLPVDGREWGHHLRMVGRLRPGVSRDQAISELSAVLPTLAKLYARGFDHSGGAPDGMVVNSLQSDLTAGVKPGLLAITGAVVLLLLIACVNVTNLLLARGAQRGGEFALRAALGAKPTHLIQQLLSESLLLAVIGGVLGLLLAQAGTGLLVAVSPAGLPRVDAIRLDGAAFAFALLVTTFVGLAVGLIPALDALRGGPRTHLQAATTGSRTATSRRELTRRTLVVCEVALALILLVGAGLLLRSLEHLFAIDPGFDPVHVLTMQVQASGQRYRDNAASARFFEQALEAVRQVRGVMSAAFASQLPLSGDSDIYGVEFATDPGNYYPAFRYGVSADYFQTMRIPLRRGRLINESDKAGAPTSVLISESFAKRKSSGRALIGERVRLGPDAGNPDRPWATIVGVVGDVKQLSLGLREPDAFYTTSAQWAWVDTQQSLVVRTTGNSATLVPAIRKAIWSVDKDVPIVRIATMESVVAQSEAQRRFALVLFETFALVALVLASTGLYGVLSNSVTERTREIGVRTALGASRRNILALIIRQGMTLVGLGVVVGLIGAAAATRALISLLFGVSPLDLSTYLGVTALLAAISALACWIPAWRASRVDPSISLRVE